MRQSDALKLNVIEQGFIRGKESMFMYSLIPLHSSSQINIESLYFSYLDFLPACHVSIEWLAEFKLTRPDPEVLQKQVDEFMLEYDRRAEATRRAREQQSRYALAHTAEIPHDSPTHTHTLANTHVYYARTCKLTYTSNTVAA